VIIIIIIIIALKVSGKRSHFQWISLKCEVVEEEKCTVSDDSVMNGVRAAKKAWPDELITIIIKAPVTLRPLGR